MSKHYISDYIIFPFNNVAVSTVSFKTIVAHSKKGNELLNLLKINTDIDSNILGKKITEILLTSQFISSNKEEISKPIIDSINNEIFSDETLEVTILPTDQCNFDCAYCYQDKRVGILTEKNMNLILKYFRATISGYKKLKLNWFGGEPTLELKKILFMLKEIKNICKRHNVLFVSRMTTNGFLLTSDYFQKLQKQNLLFYQVTIDGNERVHNKNRPLKNGNKTFSKIVKNLTDISKLSGFFQILLRVNVTKKTYNDALLFIDLFAKLFKNDKRFVLGFEKVNDWGGEKIVNLKCDLIEENSDFVYNLYNFAIKKNVNVNLSIQKDLIPMLCLASRKLGVVINYDGHVYKCPMALYSDDTIISSVNNVGYLSSDGQLIKNENFSKWNPQHIQTKCFSCNIFPVCGGLSCPKYTIIQKGDICKNYQHRYNMLVSLSKYNIENKNYIEI